MVRIIITGLLISTAAAAQAVWAQTPPVTTVTPLTTQDLQGIPGEEGTMLLVEYPPGGSDPVHRHKASVFVYVLQGTVVMQVRGGKEMTLTSGQTFFEGPDDVHIVGRNASATEPAKFIAFLVKGKDAPAVMPAK